jgi:hypothetical protein
MYTLIPLTGETSSMKWIHTFLFAVVGLSISLFVSPPVLLGSRNRKFGHEFRWQGISYVGVVHAVVTHRWCEWLALPIGTLRY